MTLGGRCCSVCNIHSRQLFVVSSLAGTELEQETTIERCWCSAGILSRLQSDPSRLAVQLLSHLPIKTLRALWHARGAAQSQGKGRGTRIAGQPGAEEAASLAVEDDLLFVVGKTGDPKAASVWAEDAEPDVFSSDDGAAVAGGGSLSAGDGDSSDQDQDSG